MVSGYRSGQTCECVQTPRNIMLGGFIGGQPHCCLHWQVTDMAGQPLSSAHSVILSAANQGLDWLWKIARRKREKERGQRGDFTCPNRRSPRAWILFYTIHGWASRVLKKTSQKKKKIWVTKRDFNIKNFCPWLLLTTQWFQYYFEPFVCSGTLDVQEEQKQRPCGWNEIFTITSRPSEAHQ